MRKLWLVGLLILLGNAMAQEPALPPGLGGAPPKSEPSLPPGLGGSTVDDGAPEPERELRLPIDIAGFIDARAGWRTQHDDYQGDARTLAETRLQLDLERRWQRFGFKFVGDFLLDDVDDDRSLDLNRGEGWFDLRQANVTFIPVDFMDVKLGRQILTWGTGDLLFINDNFPKDWVAFFSGRDVEYLKAPSDAVKVSLFSSLANLDLVYTPQFDADRYITGERLTYYHDGFGRRAGEDAIANPDRPDAWFEDDELAARLYRTVSGYELALYGYRGYWKSPAGQSDAGRPIFPKLGVYGASVRGKVLAGIGNVEVGYYDSLDDRGGDDPMVRNGEYRLLIGYEQDLSAIAKDFTVGAQYYLEYMQDHAAYQRTLPPGMPAKDEDRHVVTLRLTKLLMQQNLVLSCFAYYSPSDHDAFLRPSASYKLSDAWEVTVGGNFFLGEEEYTFFNQFEPNSNLYAALRWYF